MSMCERESIRCILLEVKDGHFIADGRYETLPIVGIYEVALAVYGPEEV